MSRRVLQIDEELFVKALARAVEDGDARFVDGHLPRLDSLMQKLRTCLGELSQLRDRATRLRGRYRHIENPHTFSAPPPARVA